MIGRAQHLNDDRLVECYYAGATGDAMDPPSAEHLADCAGCRARYAELADLLNTIRREGDAESDAVFTPERLRHQQEQILRHLEHTSHSARVISFPGRVTRHISGGAGRVAPRWLAAAAAAGLLVGAVVGGMFLDPGLHQSVSEAQASGPTVSARLTPPPAPRPVSPVPVAETFDDDAFLKELEIALERPHTRELMPFDAFTPHVREIGSRVR